MNIHRATARLIVVAFWLLIDFPAEFRGQTFKVVNMIPATWSGETTQNSEPTIGPHPTLTTSLAATAFMSGAHFCRSKTSAPIFLSSNEGDTWDLACVLPTESTVWPMDMTVTFSGDGTALYIGALDYVSPRMTANIFGFRQPQGPQATAPLTNTNITNAARTLLFSREVTDQPQVKAAPTSGLGIAVVGETRGGAPPIDGCAYVFAWVSDDPWNGTPSIDCLTTNRPIVGVGTVPAARVAKHSDGTSYAILYRPVGDGSSFDVVVYRHDPSIAGFDMAKDKPADGGAAAGTGTSDCTRHDGLAGSRVATCLSYFSSSPSPDIDFGQERRIGTELSIAIDPRNSQTVYIAWAQRSTTNVEHLELHFARSDDGGESWNRSPWWVDHATNPALAVASDGAVGILYEKLEGAMPSDRWQTLLAISADKLASAPATTQWLANVVAQQPTAVPPYLGDYIQLTARGKNFYGVFPASNDLSNGTFFNLTNQRFYDTTNHPMTKKGKQVAVSIDPYFVKVIR